MKFRKNNHLLYLTVVSIFLVWFIVAFLIYPNINIVYHTFFADGKFSIRAIEKIFTSARAVKGLKNSFLLAFTIMITSNILGIFVVLVTEYFDIAGSRFLSVVYKIPMVFGGVVLANGYLFSYGANGFLTRMLREVFPQMDPYWFSGYLAVVFVMTFACTTNHLIFLRNALMNIDYQTVEAARNLGAGSFYILRRVVFPVLKPVLLTCTIMLFQTGLMAVSAPTMVGGRDFQTIGPMILTFSERTSSRDIAAVLSLILGIAEMALLYVSIRIERKGNYVSVSKVKTPLQKQKITNRGINVVIHGLAYLLVVIYLLPLLAVVLFSFTDRYCITNGEFDPARLTLKNYMEVLTDSAAYKPFLTSIIYSALSALLVIVIVLICLRLILKYRNKATALLEYLLHIPWFVPPVMFALGMIITFDLPHWIMFNQPLVGTVFIMLIAYSVVMIPYTLRMLKSAFASFDTNLEDAAQNLGASGIRTFLQIVLPCIMPVVLAVFAINFNGKLSDYDISAFIYHPLYPPLGVVIKNNVSNNIEGDAQALNLVYSVILMIISSTILYLVYGRNSKRKEDI
ncbi:ABC transporter permease [Eisenbergiella tayi]|uniref:Putative 2-aminoethylphosphonate transport system permease protein PhnV n=1 Tax=Eisenbergiella tayi TaxID=1432052 RepID=A0A1E3A0E3_9FIRM|nr:iron ABC transporter permease [Eisenbergiella tayi]ODM02119.1 putative 2-aminoethylphosphonate transport system permease protein PhnV [Eisenbergiella tayi]